MDAVAHVVVKDLTPTLTPRLSRLLLFGDVDGAYRHPSEPRSDRSRVIQALVQAMVNALWTEDQLLAALLDPTNVGGEKLRDICDHKGEAAALRYLRRSIEKAKSRPALRMTKSNGGAEVRLIEAAALDAAPFPGRAGDVDLVVLVAHLEICKRIGSTVHDASVREIAMIAHVGRSTVAEANDRLVGSGWLTRLGRPSLRATTRWCAAIPSCALIPSTLQISPSPSPFISSDYRTVFSHGGCEEDCPASSDVLALIWNHKALGRRALRVWLVLSMGPISLDKLSELVGYSSISIEKLLVRLEAFHLAERDYESWVPGPVHPADVPATDRKSGRSISELEAERASKYEDERRRYADVTVFAKGICKPNPGPGAAAWVITDEHGARLDSGVRCISNTTNNQADFGAIGLGLKAALDAGYRRITVCSDLAMAIGALRGDQQVRNPTLALALPKIRALEERATRVTYRQVPSTNLRIEAAKDLARERLDRATQ
ncbi:MAG: reverse transcriptase-like protein [Actinomycetota bacterium]|nr:reverse transcriptase-like protein [Actinomycetota bacterium]